jgi:ADP-heptose:LPS heptosyltransferase
VHLARAVGTMSVVIYTHYTLPEETGYAENVNLRAARNGDACWKRVLCEECAASAYAVTADQVAEAAANMCSQFNGGRC